MILLDNGKYLGELKTNQAYPFTISLQNTSSEAITLSAISPGCGSCTTVNTDTMTIQPGTILPINVVFTPASSGYHQKIVTFKYFQGGQEQGLIYSFNANVV